jgi:two-component system OmpR family sensor kinase/two-component system sensor histidine kinase BaeS
MRRRFFYRVAFFLALLVVLAVGAATAVVVIVSNALGAAGAGLHPLWLVVLLIVVLIVVLSGALRGAARPIGDLVEAAGRVEQGDYGVRVQEYGPREIRGLSRAFNTMVARLQQDATQRQRLLADVSHELRTPLSVVQGNVEGLLDGVYQPDRERLTAILEETRTLARLIDDLRTLSMAESGELRLHPEPTDLGALLREAVAGFRPQAAEAGIGLDVSVTDDLPMLEVDPTRTREVVTNLLSNALRHTPRGGSVEVRATLDRQGAAKPSVAVEVADTGSGMPPDVVERVFERFYRGPGSTGTGLGLAIARELVVAQGGSIGVRSDAGRGTTMRFTLPVGAA